MRLIALGLAAAMIAAFGGPARAEDQPCAVNLPIPSSLIELNAPLDETARTGLAFSVQTALSDSEGGDWPFDVIGEAPPCSVAEITVDEETYTLSSGGDRVPLRYLTDKDGRVLAYLALAPSIEQAASLAASGHVGDFEADSPITMLTVTGSMQTVVRLYEGQPSDDLLIEDIQRMLRRELSPIARYHRESNSVSIVVPTQSGRQAVIGRVPASIMEVDGEMFVADPDGAYRMTASGFRCPESFGDFHRGDMLVMDPNRGGDDLACRFFEARGWISVFVTRIEPAPTAKKQYGQYLYEATSTNPPVGLVGEIRYPNGAYGAMWTAEDGRRQGVALLRSGHWYVEVRTTHRPDAEAEMKAAIEAVLEAAHHDLATRS